MATINGDSKNNNLAGYSSNDVLNGFGGNDTLNGGAGLDTLVGGEGNDIYIVDSATDTIIEYSGGGSHDLVQSAVSYTLGEYLNDLTLTGNSAINGTGNNFDNIITGNDASNTLNGKGGIDTLIGGKGNDTYVVDSTSDTIIEYSGGGSHDLVQSSVTYTLSTYLNDLTLTGTSAINGTGNSFENMIQGNDASNVLKGGGGNDSIQGGADDSLFGEAGNDYLVGYDISLDESIYIDGGDGNDFITSSSAGIYGGAGDDTLSGGTSCSIYGGSGNDVLSGDESFIYGEAGNDTLSGDYSNLFGGNGNDVLTGRASKYGGNGNDTLIGVAGDDYFGFDAPTAGVDTIRNFSVDDGDQIFVSASGFGGGLIEGSVITPAQFHIGAAADASDRFIYNASTGALFFDIDGIGSSSQVQLATLAGAPGITNNSIYVSYS